MLRARSERRGVSEFEIACLTTGEEELAGRGGGGGGGVAMASSDSSRRALAATLRKCVQDGELNELPELLAHEVRRLLSLLSLSLSLSLSLCVCVCVCVCVCACRRPSLSHTVSAE